MLKRTCVLVVVFAFLAVPPAIAKSSATKPAPAVKSVTSGASGHEDCPFADADFAAL
jgi:hypothetical protein